MKTKMAAKVKDVSGNEVLIDLLMIQDALDSMSADAAHDLKPKLEAYLAKLCNGVNRLVLSDM